MVTVGTTLTPQSEVNWVAAFELEGTPKKLAMCLYWRARTLYLRGICDGSCRNTKLTFDPNKVRCDSIFVGIQDLISALEVREMIEFG